MRKMPKKAEVMVGGAARRARPRSAALPDSGSRGLQQAPPLWGTPKSCLPSGVHSPFLRTDRIDQRLPAGYVLSREETNQERWVLLELCHEGVNVSKSSHLAPLLL